MLACDCRAKVLEHITAELCVAAKPHNCKYHSARARNVMYCCCTCCTSENSFSSWVFILILILRTFYVLDSTDCFLLVHKMRGIKKKEKILADVLWQILVPLITCCNNFCYVIHTAMQKKEDCFWNECF